MKRVILCMVLVVALCAVAAGSYFYIVGTTASLMNKVELVAHNFYDGDLEAASSIAAQAEREWRDFRRLRFLIIDRDNVAEITASLARINAIAYENMRSNQEPPGSPEQAEKSREIITECAVAAALLRQYTEKQRVSFCNIL